MLAPSMLQTLTNINKNAKQSYIHNMAKQCNNQKIFKWAQSLAIKADTRDFSEADKNDLFTLDKQFTEISLGVEKRCLKDGHTGIYSPKLQKAGQMVVYWKRRW